MTRGTQSPFSSALHTYLSGPTLVRLPLYRYQWKDDQEG